MLGFPHSNIGQRDECERTQGFRTNTISFR